ncbi:hypothetical protein IHE44_0010201 [Lamprotornis superbus]|uniref:Uncharacterized protein n=1 Tax=Lamprotornis superbus TaxID=245042 RepID=A0A835TP09_9PASS|nr:hypothetical protein IHE44_0010201 [Lamprotornis superbus]
MSNNTVVGSSTSAAVGSILSSGGVPISSGGFDLSCITSCYGSPRHCQAAETHKMGTVAPLGRENKVSAKSYAGQ